MSEEKSIFSTNSVFLGYVEKAGTFKDDNGKDVDFHNFLFYFSDPLDQSSDNVVNFSGGVGFEQKVSARTVCRVFGFKDFYSEFFPDDWIGCPVSLTFDRNGLKSVSLL